MTPASLSGVVLGRIEGPNTIGGIVAQMGELHEAEPWAGWSVTPEDTDRITAAGDGDLLLVTFVHEADPGEYWLKALVRVGGWRGKERETDVAKINEYVPALARHLEN